MILTKLDDVAAYVAHPAAAWVYNKLELYHKLGYLSQPHGIEPSIFPVISKPIMNLWGLGLGVDRWDSSADVKYQAGYLWMQEFSGDWMSYDIDFESGTVWQAQAECDAVWRATPSAWLVEKRSLADLPHTVISNLNLLEIPIKQINVETLGGNIIEVHLRWSHEISHWYCYDKFRVEVIWSLDPNASAPSGWIDLCDDNRPIQIATGQPHRVAHRLVL
jgi:hypothetical protein